MRLTYITLHSGNPWRSITVVFVAGVVVGTANRQSKESPDALTVRQVIPSLQPFRLAVTRGRR
jgi:hypothetical protein|tara:strand:- start:371 stop:559 length:189 start_codon:yes stop_codon:yes gene_type:complete